MKTPPQDRTYLAQCLQLAQTAEKAGEVPVGALIVDSNTGSVIAKAYNLKENLKTPLAHAEVLAIHRACKKLGRWRLTGYTLYSSLEPCVMCSGVILQARLDRVVWSAEDPKGGGHSLFGLFESNALNHQPEIASGQLASTSRETLQAFFRRKRRSQKSPKK